MTHSLLYFIVRAGNGVLAIATLAVFTRLMSPLEYGVYGLGMAIAVAASGVLFQWINVAVGRFYLMHLDDPEQVMSFAAIGFLAATGVAALISFGALFFKFISVEPATIGVVFLITVALGLHTFALQVANSQNAPGRYGMLSWTKSAGALLAGLTLVHYGAGAQGALLGFLAGIMLALIAFGPKPWLRLKLSGVDTGLSMKMYRYGLPLTLNHLAIAVVDVADRFMIGSLLGVAYVAPYAVAYDFIQLSVGPVMHIFFLSAYPTIVRVFETVGDESARNRLHVLGSRLVAVGLPAAAGIGVLAGDISDLVFGNDFKQEAAALMPWLASAIFVGAFKSYFLDVVFQLRDATKYQGYVAVLMAMTNILLNFLLLPHFGVIAAAWSTLAAFAVGALASWVIGKAVFKLPALSNVFFGSAAATATMTMTLYLLPSASGIISLSVKVAFGIVTYAVLAWSLGVFGCCRKLKS